MMHGQQNVKLRSLFWKANTLTDGGGET